MAAPLPRPLSLGTALDTCPFPSSFPKNWPCPGSQPNPSAEVPCAPPACSISQIVGVQVDYLWFE